MIFADEFSGEPDAFMEFDKVGRSVGVNAKARFLHDGAEEGKR